MKKSERKQTSQITRRHFLRESAAGLGTVALGPLLAEPASASRASVPSTRPFVPRAKSVICLFMAGGPSHVDLFDPKPTLTALDGRPMPESVIQDDRFAFLHGTPRILGSPFTFRRHGQSGTALSELLPHLAEVVDDVAVIRSMRTTAHHHAPAQLLFHTGSVNFGQPSFGAWASYGLQRNVPGFPSFAVLQSGGGQPAGGTACWGHGFLPANYQGVGLRDTELAEESAAVRAMYGAEPGQTSFANNCLMARRLVERGVPFVEVAHRGWDTHGTDSRDDLLHALPEYCRQTDRAAAALIKDLKHRGLLDSTLVIWASEFGRTPMRQQSDDSAILGRDHHPHAYSVWMAGGGIRPGMTLGQTDEFGYRVVEDEVQPADLRATILHCLGLDVRRLSNGPTDGRVIRKLLA